MRRPRRQATGEALRIVDVRKRFGEKVALDGVSLGIGHGEIVALLGPNGAGKSTLVSIVAGLLFPDSGSVEVCGIDVRRRPAAARRCLSVAAQETAVYPVLTVRENLRYYGQLTGVPNAELHHAVEYVAAGLGLSPLLDRRVQELSGGEQRRVHAAMAIVGRPDLILLDEPTVGADLHTRAALLDMVERLASDGHAVLYTTHNLHEVEELGARVAFIGAGRILLSGAVAEVVRDHGVSFLDVVTDGRPDDLVEDLRRHPGLSVEAVGEAVRVRAPDPERAAVVVLERAVRLGVPVRRLNLVAATIESVYLRLYSEGDASPDRAPDVPVAAS